MKRLALPLALLVLLAVAVWHPPSAAPIAAGSAPPAQMRPREPKRHARAAPPGDRVVVYVVGAVARPGLYALPADARVDAAVRAAGGLAAGADPAGVNLAAHAADGDEIEVPRIGEVPVGAVRAKLSRGSRKTRSKKTASIVDVNRADAAQLAQVPGIGAAIAARIVDVREHDGDFTTYDELLDVAGMTQSRLDRAQPYLRL